MLLTSLETETAPRHLQPHRVHASVARLADRLNAHVNAHFAMNAAARYVNDNFDKTMLNSRFEKNKARGTRSPSRRPGLPRPRALPVLARAHGDSRRASPVCQKTRRATLIATRRIRAGEEIYASYGDTYWTARGIDPETGEPAKPSGAPAASDL